MTHRSPFQMFTRTVLAVLAIALGATPWKPVGASEVLEAVVHAPVEADPAPVEMEVFRDEFASSNGAASTVDRAPVLDAQVGKWNGDVLAPADATAWDGPTLELAGTSPRYAGMSVHDVGCMLDESVDCGWEWAFVVRDGALCAIGLVGIGKAITAWRLKKKLEKLQEAVEAKRAKTRAIIFAVIGVLAGECLDFVASILALADCRGSTQAAAVDRPPQHFRWPSPRIGALA